MKQHPGVDRSLALGNRLLKECRAHARRTGDLASIGLALAYVQAEFLAATAEGDEKRLDAGIAIFVDQMRARALERWPEIEAARAAKKRSMN